MSLTSCPDVRDGLQVEINALQTEITSDEGAISRLKNLTQNIDSIKTATGTTTFNNIIVLNSGEFYIQYNRIDPIALLSSPSIVCYLSYRNPSQFNNGVSVNGPVTINGNNFTVNISDTGECTINCKI